MIRILEDLVTAYRSTPSTTSRTKMHCADTAPPCQAPQIFADWLLMIVTPVRR